MMQVWHDDDGRVVATIMTATVGPPVPPRPDLSLVMSPHSVSHLSHYVADGRLHPYPPRPAGDVVFDFQRRAWRPRPETE